MSSQPPTTQTLCTPCSLISLTTPTPHHNLFQLRLSSTHCPCCLLIYNMLTSQSSDFFQDEITIWPDDPGNTLVPLLDRTLTYEFPMLRGNLGSRFAFRNHDWLGVEGEQHALPSWELVVKGEKLSLDDENNKWVPRHLERTPATDSCYELIKGWLSDCVTFHDRCRQWTTMLPHMVLDLRTEDPVLILGNNCQERYAALSHCWGQKPTIVTKISNLASRMRSIPFSELPKTFQDAVQVTRRLGLQYLWIDSLCIVQDDPIEWGFESTKMMAYYRDAYITISALGSEDSHQGFLGMRSLVIGTLLSASKNLYIREKTPQLRSMFKNEPLSTRAWTLQERLLSTRIVHFSTKELIWECNTCSAREAGLTNFLSSYLGDVSIPPISGNLGSDPKLNDPLFASRQLVKVPEIDNVMNLNFKRLIIEATESNIDIIKVWKHLVEEFMMRDITKQSDRLPAISGLAQKLFPPPKFKYLAGIVQEWPYGLLWNPHAPDIISESPRLDAPSWSWAASAGPGRFDDKENDKDYEVFPNYDAEILGEKIKPSGPDMFGQISSGVITVYAYLFAPDAAGTGWIPYEPPRFPIRAPPRWLLVGIQAFRGIRYRLLNYKKDEVRIMDSLFVRLCEEVPGAYRRIGRLREHEFVEVDMGKRGLVTLA